MIKEITISQEEKERLYQAVKGLVGKELLDAPELLLHELESLEGVFHNKELEESKALAFSGKLSGMSIGPFDFDEETLEPTPVGQAPKKLESSSEMAALTLLIVAQTLGRIFTYKKMKQSGRLVQHVFPIEGMEKGQTAASSSEDLFWHTEHADKDFIADGLVLFCLRNPDQVGTRVSRPRLEKLTQKSRERLCCSSSFYFDSPDRPMSVLEKSDLGFQLRYDPVFQRAQSSQAELAYQELTQEIAQMAETAPQEPGYIVFIPNRFVTHGRGVFKARYDGQDRWLMRCFIASSKRLAEKDQYLVES